MKYVSSAEQPHDMREPAPMPSLSGRRARLIAFYLPQFHPIPENDSWWGNGFTEWTNVAKATPLFRGHYQPRIPADLGFYDLRCPETRQAQADMAREHGIEAFCYWHYWFAGERLLERPFNEVLRSGEPDLPFCLAWANESWTGIWYGAGEQVLKLQSYPGPEDHRAHFYYLLKAFADPRYVRVEGRPLFLIYKPLKIPDRRRVFDLWRELALKEGFPGLHIVGIFEHGEFRFSKSDYDLDGITLSHHSKILRIAPTEIREKIRRKLRDYPPFVRLYRDKLHRPLRVYRYEDALPLFIEEGPLPYEYYPCVVPQWDNSPRSGLNGLILHDSTPELFRRQTKAAIERANPLPQQRRMIFIKSWNEWAEGNYLEPDQRFGKEYLSVLRQEIGGLAEVPTTQLGASALAFTA